MIHESLPTPVDPSSTLEADSSHATTTPVGDSSQAPEASLTDPTTELTESTEPTDSTEAPTATPAAPAARKKSNGRSSRRRSRELALQGLYQWLLSGSDLATVSAHMREQDGFAQADAVHFDALLYGCVEQAAALDAMLSRHVDRKTSELSPVEHGILMIGAYELAHCIDIPYRVAINEAVELAKSFGGTDGHKYVNGVLDKAAGDLRPLEVQARRAGAAARG